MFNEILKKLRKEKGVSQEELSEILDVSRQSISKYENGTSQPSFEKLSRLANYFEVSIDVLLGNAELENNATEVINNFVEKKILIYSHVDKKVSSFYKFVISPVALKKEHHPEVMLRGIDGHSFLGDSTVSLGWYEKKIDAEQELAEILKAISEGEPTYELKYDIKVKKKGIVDLEMDL